MNLPQNGLGESPAMAHTGESGQGIEYEYCHGAGIHYNWHRWYDPDSGRYLSPDPVAFRTNGRIAQYSRHMPNLLVPYSYANGNPVSHVDADGAFGLPGAGAGAIGGAITGAYYGGLGGYTGTLAQGGTPTNALQNAVVGVFFGGLGGAAGGAVAGALGNPVGALVGGAILGNAISTAVTGGSIPAIGGAAACGGLAALSGDPTGVAAGSAGVACSTAIDAIVNKYKKDKDVDCGDDKK